jgi:hypothetical protein
LSLAPPMLRVRGFRPSEQASVPYADFDGARPSVGASKGEGMMSKAPRCGSSHPTLGTVAASSAALDDFVGSDSTHTARAA